MAEIFLNRMTSPEIRACIADIDAVLIPVGATEQHGPHLELSFDSRTAVELCRRTALAVQEKGGRALVAPEVHYGVSWYHMNYAGTVSLSHETFMSVIHDIVVSLASHGFRNLIIVNGHGGNSSALSTCLDRLYQKEHIRVLLAQWFTMAAPEIKKLGMVSPMLHAGEAETSVGLALGMPVRTDKLPAEEHGRMEKLRQAGYPVSDHICYDPMFRGSGVLTPMDFMDDISDSGAIGDAGLGSAEKGRQILAYTEHVLTNLILDLAGRKC
ncbi:creatininase family protein [Mailhella massiliensis]|uniref:Creatininase family protein n=1 Tax=Mailhella massiliensis TaxID=1903261 RepID=A0A921AWD3_9BACT|nr:creatininase family protein [Mailhella massiliensis]HJD97545.1 creatininase family protein [Mailhella massiliensis]